MMETRTRQLSEAAVQAFTLSRNAELYEEIVVASTKSAKSGSSTILPFVVRIIKPARKAGALCCPACHSPLNLIQPEEDEPTRLLGTCDSCSRWCFLVELEPDWKKALMLELPTGDEISRRHAEIEEALGDPAGS